jgi:predicted transposase/invertase (TIGR01784 family)
MSITQVEQEIETSSQNAFVELIETIIVYKFPQKTREEIATMLGLGDLTQTRFYQEAFGEGRQEGEYLAKLTTIRRLLEINLPVEVIAQGVELSMAEVQKILDQLEQRDNTSEG